MKSYILAVFIFWGLSVVAQQTTKTAAELKKEMGKIMHETNWSDQAQADTANVRIAEISRQMLLIGARQQAEQQGAEISSENDSILQVQVDYKLKLWDQIQESAAGGEGADINLAKSLREEIVEAYKEDESPKIIRKEFLQEMTVLVIDMSIPTIQRVIEQMQNFKSIKTLIITGGKLGMPVNLSDLLHRAADYPLETLEIINFHQFVTEIPDDINHYKDLKTLAVYNNNLSRMPELAEIASHLDSLYIDLNPINTVFPEIQKMTNLKTLGIAKTSVSEAEIEEIKKLIPNCKILTQ